jgi:hypothetical protein
VKVLKAFSLVGAGEYYNIQRWALPAQSHIKWGGDLMFGKKAG